MYRITEQKNKISAILKQNTPIFHTQDLAMLWGISNKNTLYHAISRFAKCGILHALYKGMYATQPLEQLDPLLLGLKALHCYGYISCETVLMHYGLINQLPQEITLVSEQSRRFTIGTHRYRSRQLADAFLYNVAGIEEHNTIRMATPERAVADMLYFHPRFHFDAPVDWQTVQSFQRIVGYPLTPQRYAHTTT